MRRPNENISTTILISFIISALVGFLAGTLAYDYLISLSGGEAFQIIKNQKQAKEQISSRALSQEEQVIQVVKEAAPAVVSIIVSKDLPVIEQYYEEYDPFKDFFGRDFFDDFFKPFKFRIPQYRQKGTEKREIGGGTGFIVSCQPAEGCLILTNKHVVADKEASYTVLTNEGEKFEAQVLARDPVNDIAILKVEEPGLPGLKLGDSDKIQIGQTVIAIGNALGEFRNTVSLGVVSGLKRSITATSGLGQIEQLAGVIQTDAAINQGNSGGPLLNLRGEVIGINVAMALGAENIGFALPINIAKRGLEQVKAKGKISYPFLGVRYVLITPEIQKKNNLPVDYGALIIRGETSADLAVIPGSPADQAGLVENDIILEVDGTKVDSKNNLARLIQEHQIGDLVNLKVLHKGQEKMVQVKLGERQ